MKTAGIRLLAICLGTIVLVVGSVSAQQGLALMKVDPGARPAGMGGAFVSVAGDANSPAYNPAGAVSLDKWAFSVGHNAYWENVRLETGYIAGPLSSKIYIHGGIRVAAVDDLAPGKIKAGSATRCFFPFFFCSQFKFVPFGKCNGAKP